MRTKVQLMFKKAKARDVAIEHSNQLELLQSIQKEVDYYAQWGSELTYCKFDNSYFKYGDIVAKIRTIKSKHLTNGGAKNV